MIFKIKRISAAMLLIAFFLPLSKCTLHPPPEEVNQKPSVEDTYAYTAYEWPSLNAALAVLAFVWPLFFVFSSAVKPGLNQLLFINIIELFLCLGSGTMITIITYLGELMSGAYMAAISLVLYAVASVITIVKITKAKIYAIKT